MSARSADAESRDNSPQEHDGSPDRRASKKRKVLSCYPCRNRKMKCDRVYPVCGRCQKTGRDDQCHYDPRLLEEAPHHNGSHVHGTNDTFGRSENWPPHDMSGSATLDMLRFQSRIQERRIQELERKLTVQESHNTPSQPRYAQSTETQIKEEIMFRGKGFKTAFHGCSSVMSTISQVHGRVLGLMYTC